MMKFATKISKCSSRELVKASRLSAGRTGAFCDVVAANWYPNNTQQHACDDCNLSPLRIQLEAPIAYDTDRASAFASLTASCGATGYSYSTPLPYTVSASTSRTSTTSATASSGISQSATACATPYTLAEGENCTTIAAAQNVSTYNLIYANNFDVYCSLLPPSGSEICLPETCATHRVVHGDSCVGLTKTYGMTQTQLLAWNTIIDAQCRNIELLRGWYICVGSVFLCSTLDSSSMLKAFALT